jgi:hypothetical protein
MSFWGKAAQVVSFYPAAIAGIGKGAYNVASGNGSFSDGVEKTVDKALESAERFGEQHSDKLTGAAISLGTAIAGNEYKKHRG